jgi:hypothetical protein
MLSLKDKHKGQTAWIIGKGPSLQYLKASDIGEGPVIAINQAITAVESLELPNQVYSLQKDGGTRRRPSSFNLSPDCDHSGDCGDQCGNMIRPKGATLLLHDLESKYCFPDYPKRHVLNLQEMGLPLNIFSLVFALRAAKYMGCVRFNFVSCDAHAVGDIGTYVPKEGIIGQHSAYRDQRLMLPAHLEGLDYRFITPGKQTGVKISFGVMVNDPMRLDMVLRKSEIQGDIHYIPNPPSATKGLNILLDEIEKEGADVAVLAHQDMHFRQWWIPQLRDQLARLPESWVVAGVIGKDTQGRICGKFHDMRVPHYFDTSDIHEFPHPACCFDECVIIVNLKKGFRFDESLDGFDLSGTLCVLQTWEMGGTAWVIDAFAEHYCLRPFTWVPDEKFRINFKMLHDRFNKMMRVDSTALGVPEEARRFETSAA